MQNYKISKTLNIFFIVFLFLLLIFLWFLFEFEIYSSDSVIVENKGEYLEFSHGTEEPNKIETINLKLDNNDFVIKINSWQNLKDGNFLFKIKRTSLPRKYWNLKQLRGEIIGQQTLFFNLIFKVN